MKTPRAINTIAPTVAPTPIPAFAPEDKPPLELGGGDVVGVEDEVDEGSAVEDGPCVLDGADESDSAAEDDSVGIGSPNTLAITYLGRLLSSLQQSVVSPQHHVVEESRPSHGTTIELSDLCVAYTRVSIFAESSKQTGFDHSYLFRA